jgi:nucleoside-diphosphate-sugar epimerase
MAKELGFTGKPEYVPLPPGEQRRSVLDGTAAQRDFGLPRYTPLEEGLKKTAEFFRKEKAPG